MINQSCKANIPSLTWTANQLYTAEIGTHHLTYPQKPMQQDTKKDIEG